MDITVTREIYNFRLKSLKTGNPKEVGKVALVIYSMKRISVQNNGEGCRMCYYMYERLCTTCIFSTFFSINY